MEAEYEIKLTTSHKPFNQIILRRFPIPLFPKVKEEMARMEVMEVTEKVDAPTEWYSPAVVVPKFKWKSTDVKVRTLSTPCLQQGRPLGSWQA